MELSNKVNYPVKDKSGVVKQKILSKNFSFGSNKSELLEKLIKFDSKKTDSNFNFSLFYFLIIIIIYFNVLAKQGL